VLQGSRPTLLKSCSLHMWFMSVFLCNKKNKRCMLLLEHKYSVCAASVAVFILFKCEYKKSYWVRSVTSVWCLHLCRTPLVFIGSVFVCPRDRRLPLRIPLRFVTASATTVFHHSEEKAHNGSYCLKLRSLS
jgi:uncharacterized membrane protein